MTSRLCNVTIDARSPAELARFWSAVLDYPVVQQTPDKVRLRGPRELGAPDLLIMLVDAPTPGKNRWHLDIVADDVDGEIQRLLHLGANLISRHDGQGRPWAVLHDPEDNAFCISTPRDDWASPGGSATSHAGLPPYFGPFA